MERAGKSHICTGVSTSLRYTPTKIPWDTPLPLRKSQVEAQGHATDLFIGISVPQPIAVRASRDPLPGFSPQCEFRLPRVNQNHQLFCSFGS